MRIEVPECKRCCFCLPLRRGVLTYAYISLCFTIFCTVIELVVGFDTPEGITLAVYRGSSFITRAWLALLLYFTDIGFTIVLIVGAHKKSIRLLNVYFYYGVATTLATFLTILVINLDIFNSNLFYTTIEISFVICAIILHVYMLCLVRNLMKKLRLNSGLTFVNNVTEVVVEPAQENMKNTL